MATYLMVELDRGYGDGYGVVASDDGLTPRREPGHRMTHYRDGAGGPTPAEIETWRRDIIAAPSVLLTDGGVKVPGSAVRRVIGPLDCPEAVRVRAGRYTRDWRDRAFVAAASDADLLAALSHADVYAAMTALRRRLTPAPA